MRLSIIMFAFSLCAGLVAAETVWAEDAALLGAPETAAAKMEKWKEYISNYKPDYSDSSKYLNPPETGRLKKPLPIVRDGKAVATINYSSEEGIVAKTAAEELQFYISEITGVKLPIRDSVDPRGETQIIIGKRTRDISYGQQLFGDELKKLSNSDGYVIRNIDNKLYIFGEEAKGAINGIYALLENNTDIIWARPNKDFGTVFSKVKDLDFVWGDNILEIPDSRTRGWNGYADLEWMARNKCNGFYGGAGGDISWMNAKKQAYGSYLTLHLFGHNIGHFVSSKKYFNEHPEYYSLVNGKRAPWNQYCFTNQEMKKVFIENALDFIRRAPEDIDAMHIDMDDTWNACQCENCTAPIRLADGAMLKPDDPAFRSTQYFMFMNDVMAAVNKEFPRMQIKTLAYFSTAVPPKFEVNPNIRPTYAPYVRVNDKAPLFAPENKMWLDYLEGWAKKSKNIDVYDYYGLGLGFPRPLAEVRALDFQEMHKYVVGMASEYTHMGDTDKQAGKIWDYSAMEFWVLTRLYWNPKQDVEQLRKYYIRRVFREAAPSIEKFYGTIRQEWFRNSRASTIGDSPVELTKFIVLEPGHEDALRGYLAEAEKTAVHPVSKEMVKRLSARFEEQVATAKSIKIPEISVPLLRPQGKVDFDNPVWKGAAKIDSFKKAYSKGNMVDASNPSDALLFHDSNTLYAYFRLFDKDIANMPFRVPPSGKENDFIPEADHMEIFICDPLQDGVYYMFAVDPNGVTADLKGYDDRWNCKWEREVRKLDDRWEVIMRIPLESINASNAQGNVLKGLFLREYHKHGKDSQREYSSWGGGNHHQTITFGTIRLMR